MDKSNKVILVGNNHEGTVVLPDGCVLTRIKAMSLVGTPTCQLSLIDAEGNNPLGVPLFTGAPTTTVPVTEDMPEGGVRCPDGLYVNQADTGAGIYLFYIS